MTPPRHDYGAALAALVAGATVDGAARAGNVPLAAFRRYVRSDAGLAAVAVAEHEHHDRTRRAVITAGPVAVRTLVEVASNPTINPSARVAASRTILDMIFARRVELTATVEHVETDYATILRSRFASMRTRLGTDLIDVTLTPIDPDEPPTPISLDVHDRIQDNGYNGNGGP